VYKLKKDKEQSQDRKNKTPEEGRGHHHHGRENVAESKIAALTKISHAEISLYLPAHEHSLPPQAAFRIRPTA
jgi:hypothetical protein